MEGWKKREMWRRKRKRKGERTDASLAVNEDAMSFRQFLVDEMDTRSNVHKDILVIHVVHGDLAADERLSSAS